MTELFFVIFCFFTIIPLTTLIHEFGHFFCARICRAENISIMVGFGRELIRFRYSQYSISFHILPLGGVTLFELNESISRWRVVFISFGGPILNGLIGFMLITQFQAHSELYISNWLLWLALFNLWMSIINLFPIKIGTFSSDGFAILKALSMK